MTCQFYPIGANYLNRVSNAAESEPAWPSLIYQEGSIIGRTNAHTINRRTIVSMNGSMNVCTITHINAYTNACTNAHTIDQLNVSMIDRPYERLHACTWLYRSSIQSSANALLNALPKALLNALPNLLQKLCPRSKQSTQYAGGVQGVSPWKTSYILI